MKTPTKSNGGGFFARFGFSRQKWNHDYVAPAAQITQSDAFAYGAGMTTVASLLGHGLSAARARMLIYDKWQMMEADPIVASAIQLLVTAALGGHETTGELIFIEEAPAAKKNKKLMKVVEDVRGLLPLFNRIAFQTAAIGAAYGDAYARVYADNTGVVDVYTEELVRPQLVQAYERGGRTIGYSVSIGDNCFQRLNCLQMARLKMQRTRWTPQYGVVEKAYRFPIEEDDPNKLPIMPSCVGGSFLFAAERPYDNLVASLLGLVGQRWIDSIDEQIVTANMKAMSQEQKEAFLKSIKNMLLHSKEVAENAVKRGFPVLERIRHIIPVFDDKQVLSIVPANGGTSGRTSSITIDDVLLHAKLLAGALGVDISMLGFADQLSGGLGEGGFFRVSAQVAERARIIRVALEDFFNEIINIHTYYKYGMVFKPEERPWDISFYGSLSALEAERQRTRSDGMNAGSMVVQTLQMLKDMGATEDVGAYFLQKGMMLDEEEAKTYAKILSQKDENAEGAEGFGSGMGGMMQPQNDGNSDEEESAEENAGGTEKPKKPKQKITFKAKETKQTEKVGGKPENPAKQGA